MVVLPKAFGQKPFSAEEVKRELDEFFGVIVPQLNRGLAQYEYFCCNDITAADIVIYYELRTVLILHKRDLVSIETPDLFAWYGRISKQEAVIKMDDLFIGIVKKYQLI
jgi:glutathione S-transferase